MSGSPPTLYEYFTAGGVASGLFGNRPENFTLNNKSITLYGGSMDYFRVHPKYWKDRLRKMRAAGLNTLATYVPWNLHEPTPGVYDFGKGGTDFQEFLYLEKFLRMVKEEDMFVILRPGPYICAEWEFGGMPSWLLREKDIKIRTSDALFLKHVERYFKTLLTILFPLQFTKGGPIIAFQIENEYGKARTEGNPVDNKYMDALKIMFIKQGINELLLTSDTPSSGFSGCLPGILSTANFQNEPEKELKILKQFQPNRPLLVMQYWTGRYDHWTDEHYMKSNQEFCQVLEQILAFPASVNFYMFHGGTNFGFMNGANILGDSEDNGGYMPDTSSYDFDAPLTEAGDYTDKYYSLRSLISQYNTQLTRLPELPELKPRVAYPSIKIIEYMSMRLIIDKAPHHIEETTPISMEFLPINENTGQQYGYIVYRKMNLHITPQSILKIEGRICDTAIILINDILISEIIETREDLDKSPNWKRKDYSIHLGPVKYLDATLEIIVENHGRSNFGLLNQYNQRKGLWQGSIFLNNHELNNWEIVPLEFKKKWVHNLTAWIVYKSGITTGPGLYKATLDVATPLDTYVDTRNWKKGFIIVNDFVLSRYFHVGPQQTAYLPAPLLHSGENQILFFEHFIPSDEISFSLDPIYETF